MIFVITSLWNQTQLSSESPKNSKSSVDKMEFLLYLNPIGQKLVEKVIRAGYQVKENVEYCEDGSRFGYSDGNSLVICTENIKQSGYDVKHYINETLYHEVVHVAHMCNGYRPFYIPLENMPLSSSKLQDVKNSVKMSTSSAQMEHEAYWMEDKPDKVKYVVQKYCF